MPCGPDGAKLNCVGVPDGAPRRSSGFHRARATSPASRTFTDDCVGPCLERAVPSWASPILNRRAQGVLRSLLLCSTRSSLMGPRLWARSPARRPGQVRAMVEGHKEAGFYNHGFIATKAGGAPMVCIWEARPTVPGLGHRQQRHRAGTASLDNAVFKMAPGARCRGHVPGRVNAGPGRQGERRARDRSGARRRRPWRRGGRGRGAGRACRQAGTVRPGG